MFDRNDGTKRLLFEEGPPPSPETRKRPSKRCNDLDGQAWLRYSISVWDDIRKTPEEARLGHPAMFPTMLVRRLIQMLLTKRRKVVLDPFVGSGSTVIAAMEEGKQGIGLDVSPDYIHRASRRVHEQRSLWNEARELPTPVLKVADARALLEVVEPRSVDLCVTSPPYWNILNQKRTADYKDIRHYGNRQEDLGTVASYEEFLGQLGKVFEQVFVSLRPESFCVVIVMDLRKKDRFYPFHSDVAATLQKIGFIFDDLIIWNRKSEYNNLRPLGYPAVFRVNKIHEFVLLFKTPPSKVKRSTDRALCSTICNAS